MLIKDTNIDLFNEDCMKVMKRYEDNYFDLAVVDPPYGIKDHIINGGESKKKIKLRSELSKWDYKPTDGYFRELYRVSKNQIIWGANYFTENVPFSRGWIVWDKIQPVGIALSKAELAYTSFNINMEIFRYRTANQRNKIHSCQKPVKLYDWIYHNYSEAGQKILDTHLGSGSNAISAHYAKMSEFVGCELDEDYFKSASERIFKETRQLELF